MKNNVIYNNASGLYLVVGSGFISDTACNATKFTALEAQSQVKCAQSLGLDVSAEEIKIEKSFAVNYIRQEDINVMGQVNPNAKNPSKRRFATRAEAVTHGSRFAVRKAKGSKIAGSAGHIGFYVTETNEPVNAAINPQTGLTNSLEA